MTSNPDSNGGFAIVNPDDVEDHYEGSDVPGDEIRTVRAPAAVSVAPGTPRQHRE